MYGLADDPLRDLCYETARDLSFREHAGAVHYDPDTNPPGSSYKGCWRMLENGKRYREGRWPTGNINEQFRPDNVCNSYDRNALLF